jgi:membrane protease YdiL (CAAX protease family)
VTVSFLWGIWHFPIAFKAPSDCLSLQGLQVVLYHTVVGCLLSFTARAAGNLMPSAFAHAIIDSVRNVLGQESA